MTYEIRDIRASHNILATLEGAPPRIGEHFMLNDSNTRDDDVFFKVIDVLFYQRKGKTGCAVLVTGANPTPDLESLVSVL